MAAHTFHVLFHVVFQNFYASSKFCTLVRVYPKYSRLDLNLPILPPSGSLGYPPLPHLLSDLTSVTL